MGTTAKTLYRSFAGGVITPEMFGRLDLVKFQTGLAEADGFIILPHGPAANRTGFEYTLEVKDSSKVTCLIPFTYSTSQSMVLEFGDFYVRFHTQGANLLEAALNIVGVTQANPGVVNIPLHGYVTGQWVYGVGITGMTTLNSRFFKVVVIDPNNFSLTDLWGVAINTAALPAFGGAGTFARVYEIVSPYATADLFDLHFTQSNDVLSIVDTAYQQRELRRLGATNWQFNALAFSPTQVVPPSAAVVPLPVSGAVVNRYKVTAIAQDGLEESYATVVTSGLPIAITAVTLANPGVLSVAAHGRAVGDAVLVEGATGMTTLNGEWLVNSTPTGGTLSLRSLSGVPLDTTALAAYIGGGTLKYAAVVNDLATVGNKNTITIALAASALRYNVYKYFSGLFGYIGATAENIFVDNNIVADTTKTPPIPDDPFTSANNYPGAVGYYGGRRWFGGTLTRLQQAWGTRSGTESNMSYSVPTRADDRISFRLAAKRSDVIRHIVPLEDLVMLTASGEWVIAATTGTLLTPSSVDPRPKGSVGASNVQPVLTGQSAIYAQDRGGRVREFIYSGSSDANGGGGGYRTNDISLMAPHYFDGYTIRQFAFSRAPYPIAWCVRSDGLLLGVTYLPEQQVLAWHSHSATGGGTFESVCVVPEGNEDVLYCIVKRTINGRTTRYVERLHTRLFSVVADCFFVDGGVSYSGAPITNVTGGWHLEGQAVSVLADGAVVSGVTILNGGFTLETPASKITFGLPITARLKTLPISLETQALGQGTQKNVNKIYMRVNNSSGIHAGRTYATVKEFTQRTNEPYGAPPALVSTEIDLVIDSGWNPNGQICVQQKDPLPLTVMSITTEVALGS